ncbi:MAG: IS66 family insertion sequence element accessory protein TnpB [Verrucomicrobiota bacterium]
MSLLESERCYVYGGVADLRKGADGLRALVGEAEQGVLYVFSNRTRASLKFLSVDSAGVFCGTRRLHHSRFDWPESPEGKEKLTADELACLLIGDDVKKLRFKKLLAGD